MKNKLDLTKTKISKEAIEVIKALKEKGFLAYLVGGCLRDLLLEKTPKDWDIATSAKPEEIQKIFKKTIYDNRYGTVKVIFEDKVIEVTPFRKDIGYSDRRHPDKVEFGVSLKEDLSRRDFTINAFALDLKISKNCQILDFKIIDYFNGISDLKKRIIRGVGDSKKRFQEDALRLIRAIRFSCQLDFEIEKNTFEAIKENAYLIKNIAKERIRDELEKIILTKTPKKGFLLLHQSGLLKYIIPELEKGVGISQNRHHIYTIFQHCLLSLKYAALYNYNLNVRLAALFHDIAKPQTKQGEGPDATFYNHDILGAKFAAKILSRLRFPKKTIEKVATLIRYHMFFYDPKTVTESSVRRLLRKVGPENIKELIQLRICDRKGSGVPKAKPYRLRHFEYMVSKVSRDPISVKMLKVNGNDVMSLLNIKPGPKVGLVLNALLWEVLEEPKRNKKEYLEKRIKELGQVPDENLREIGKKVMESIVKRLSKAVLNTLKEKKMDYFIIFDYCCFSSYYGNLFFSSDVYGYNNT